MDRRKGENGMNRETWAKQFPEHKQYEITTIRGLFAYQQPGSTAVQCFPRSFIERMGEHQCDLKAVNYYLDCNKREVLQIFNVTLNIRGFPIHMKVSLNKKHDELVASMNFYHPPLPPNVGEFSEIRTKVDHGFREMVRFLWEEGYLRTDLLFMDVVLENFPSHSPFCHADYFQPFLSCRLP